MKYRYMAMEIRRTQRARMDNIPLATAYPWAPSERPNGVMPRKRKRIGSGFAALQMGLQEETSAVAQSILSRLLNDAGIELDGDQPPIARKLSLTAKPRCHKEVVSSALRDDQVLRGAQAGQWSFLGTILNVVNEAAPGSVSAKQIIRICALSVRPGDVPGQMDAKEMVLAAINFLSYTGEGSSSSRLLVPTLPLIRPLQDNPDLEKRYYEKVDTWDLFDLVQSEPFQNLEALFCSSASWEWLGRERFCPRLLRPVGLAASSAVAEEDEEEALFLLKGSIPARALPAKVSRKGEGGSRKRKTLVSMASSAVSVASNASGEPEQEATLVIEDDDSLHGGDMPSHPLF